MKIVFLILLTVSLFLTGCASLNTETLSKNALEIVPNENILLPTPAQLHLNVKARQILTGQYALNGKTHSQSSEVALEANSQKLSMVAFTPMGTELFSMEYDGEHIQKSALPIPNVDLGVEHGLADFLFAYAPSEAIPLMLKNTDITFKESEKQRLFMLNNQKLIQIDYEFTDPWKGKIFLQNFALHYSIVIETVSVSKET